jgi:hypothetical protein
MAPWDEERFRRLENVVIATMERKRPVIDVPYYVFLYSPSEELRAIDEFQNLERRLNAKGFSAEAVWMPDLMISALRKFRLLDPEIVSLESERRDRVKTDLERILPEEIVSQLRTKLKSKEVDHCAILLRCGALYPFVHVSTVLSSLEGFVRCTLIVGYPGDKEGQMLNERGETIRSYYRAEVI